jgi:hypothetical protein
MVEELKESITQATLARVEAKTVFKNQPQKPSRQLGVYNFFIKVLLDLLIAIFCCALAYVFVYVCVCARVFPQSCAHARALFGFGVSE